MILNKKAFTLTEILIVISIIGLFVVFAVPAFDKYGRNSDFREKADEVRLLINQTYILSQNPASIDIQSYHFYAVDNQTFRLESIQFSTLANSTPVPTTIKEVKLIDSGESFTSAPTNNNNHYELTCPTTRGQLCNLSKNGATGLDLIDNKVSVAANTAHFVFNGVQVDNISPTVSQPFSIQVQYP